MLDKCADDSVFINCPFDKDYSPLLKALVFTLLYCGFQPRLASEESDSGQVRIERIKKLIAACRYSIHDISRIEPLQFGDLPRFNMPFELGLDFGCRFFGKGRFKEKRCLIVEAEPYRYQKVLSDISGNDIRHHNREPQELVRQCRNWLTSVTKTRLPPSSKIWYQFVKFTGDLSRMAGEEGCLPKEVNEMAVPEFISYIRQWMNLERE